MVESQTGRENRSKRMVRMERDPLGEKEVPADAYYGIQTVRAVENFPVSGLRPFRDFMWAMAANWIIDKNHPTFSSGSSCEPQRDRTYSLREMCQEFQYK